jgi:hypothetical protein
MPVFFTCIALCALGASGQDIADLKQKIIDLEQRVMRIEKQLDMQAETMPAAKQASPGAASPSQRTPLPLRASLISKKRIDSDESHDQKNLAFLIELKNNGDKDINVYRGDITIARPGGGEELVTFSASIAEYIAARDSATWYGAIPYDQNSQSHQHVLRAAADMLSVILKPEQIIFTDGSIASY